MCSVSPMSTTAARSGLELAYDFRTQRCARGQSWCCAMVCARWSTTSKNIASPRAGNHLPEHRSAPAVHRVSRAQGGGQAQSCGLGVRWCCSMREAARSRRWSTSRRSIPNGSRSNQSVGGLRNRAVTDLFEPGSTMKPFTVAAALDAGAIRADSIIDTAPGYFRLGAARSGFAEPEGDRCATILRRSSNVGAAKIALSLEKKDLCGRPWTGSVSERASRSVSRRGVRAAQRLPALGADRSRPPCRSVTASRSPRCSWRRPMPRWRMTACTFPVSLLKRDRPEQGVRVFSAESAAPQCDACSSPVTTEEGTAP